MTLQDFFAELKRRNVVRMAGLYLVGAWLLTQVATTLLPMFGGPDWLLRSIVILLAIGFIPALIFSWVFELTPEGLKRDEDVPPSNHRAANRAADGSDDNRRAGARTRLTLFRQVGARPAA